jgi:NAD+ kinase
LIKPKTFGIWANTDKAAVWKMLPEILNWGKSAGLETWLTTRIQKNKPKSVSFECPIIETAEDFKKLDFILSLGGDGTMLSLARAVFDRGTPILGIHLGELGFLAEVIDKDMFQRLDLVAQGKYRITERNVLQCSVSNGSRSRTLFALNDFVINNGPSVRMLNAQLEAGGLFVANYKADGLIIATPTGSTAYSLAAGGPVVVPGLDSMVVSPICPHSLTFRPIVFPAGETLSISFPGETTDSTIDLAVDGQITESLGKDSAVSIKAADYKIKLIEFDDSNYFHTLRTKMGWGKRGEG